MSEQIPRSPYKGLIPYSEGDAQFFFGRDQKREVITANLLASRLTLLHGASGVGKSSVLRAGVAYHLRKRAEQSVKEGKEPEFAVVVFSSWRDDPVEALANRLRESVARITGGQLLEPLPPSRELTKTLQTWTRRDPDGGKPDLDLLIILDQFEEYFLYHPTEKGDGTFATELPRAINNTELRANFLISIREDALAKLERFKGSIPCLFENRLSLEHLDQQSAREAITKPIDQFNLVSGNAQPISIEPSLVDAILQQVKTGQVFLGQAGRGVVEADSQNGERMQIETPFLQMVLTRLWDEEMNSDSRVLRLETLNRLGGAARIVRTHLDQTIETLSTDAQDIASRIFFHLVTPSGTKIAHTVPDLLAFAKVSEDQLDPVLAKLADKSERILRSVDPSPNQPGVQRYEIFHDVLAPAILDWRTRYMQAKNQAQAEKRAAEEAAKKEHEAAHLLKLQQAEALAEAQRSRAEEQQRRFETERLRAEEQLYQAQSERKHARQLRLAIVGLCILLVVSSAASVVAYRQTLAANDALASADAEKYAAVRLRDEADIAKGEAIAEKAKAQIERDAAQAAENEAIKQKGIAEKARSEAEHSKEYAITQKRLADAARLEAEKQTKIAHSDEVAAKAINQLKANPELAVLLARESLKKLSGLEANPKSAAEALHAAIQALPDRKPISIENGLGALLAGSFSPDGKRLATYNSDKSIKIWDVTEAKPPLTLTSEFKPNLPFAFAADAKVLASAGPNGSILLWDAESGKLLDRSTDLDKVLNLRFIASNKLVASGWSHDVVDGKKITKVDVRLWSINANGFGAPVSIGNSISNQVKDPPTGSITGSPNGDMLSFVLESGAVVLFDLATSKITSKFGCMEIPATARPALMAFSSDGKRFGLACTDGGVQVWDVASAAPPKERTRVYGYPLGEDPLAFNSNLDYLATTGADFSVRVRRLWHFDLRERVKVITLVGHNARILGGAFSSDGTSLITASSDKTANVWKLGPGYELATFAGPWVEVAGIAFSPDGRQLVGAIADTRHPQAEIWDTFYGEALGELTAPDFHDKVWAVAYNRDATLIATGGGDNAARIWDAKTGRLIRKLVPPDNRPTTIREVAFSPDGSRLATASDDGTARIWNVSTDALMSEFKGEEGEMRGVAFSPDGAHLATANAEGTATIWDLATGKRILNLVGHNDVVWKVAFSPDGQHIATASHDGTAKVWDASSGEEQFTLIGHSDKLWGIAFSGDGKKIATASSDKTARIWDAKSGKELLVLTGHLAGVNRAVFSPDNKRLATSGEDGTVRLYTLDLNDLMDLSHKRVARELTERERKDYLP